MIGIRRRDCGVWALALAAAFTGPVFAQQKSVGTDSATLARMRKAGTDYLRTTQGDDGSWSRRASLGITALITTACLESGLKPDDKMVAQALKVIEAAVQKDGGIYGRRSRLKNYETCICIMALSAANGDGKYTKTIKNADSYLRKSQFDEGEKLESSDSSYGGVGYGGSTRPDLSNTHFLLEALKAAGAKKDDPAVQKALKFVSRCQNLETEHNTTKFAAKINDGGFYYTPAGGGSSPAGKTKEGGLKSYGAMTYAGFKSLIYAGLDKKDKRVKAALDWISRNYTLDRHPGGLGTNGLYYYYSTFAKALDAAGVDYVEDAKGMKHDWRKELAEALQKRQQKNGSWVNKRSDRWFEGFPSLATAYALLALNHCDQKPLR